MISNQGVSKDTTIEDIAYFDDCLLVLDKFNGIKVRRGKTYTKKIGIGQLSRLMDLTASINFNDAYFDVIGKELINKLNKELLTWKEQIIYLLGMK